MKQQFLSVLYVSLLILFCMVIGITFFVISFLQPKIHREEVTPDKQYVIQIGYKRLPPVYIEGIDVFLIIRNKAGEMLYKESFGYVDIPHYIDEEYPLAYTNEEVKIGPYYCDGKDDNYLVVKFADLKTPISETN